MLQAVELPAGVADLAAGLADVDRDRLTHGGRWGRKGWIGWWWGWRGEPREQVPANLDSSEFCRRAVLPELLSGQGSPSQRAVGVRLVCGRPLNPHYWYQIGEPVTPASHARFTRLDSHAAVRCCTCLAA
eukprot:186060-Chlamydomonas_euryale.AAC.2